MKYQKDIDEFMQVVRERVTGNYSQVWFGLYNGLKDIIPQEDKAYLIAQWEAHQTELAINNWRDRFMEATIDEAAYAKDRLVGAYGATAANTATNAYQNVLAQQMQQSILETQKQVLMNNLLSNGNNIWDVPGVKG